MNPLAQPLTASYFIDVEKQLRRIFYDILFRPLLDVLQGATAQAPELLNVKETWIVDALRTGRIQYSNGIFSGEFSAAISKALRRLGAAFDPRSRIYRIEPSRVPAWVVAEAAAYAMKAKGIHEELQRVLNETQSHLESLVYDHSVNPTKSIDAIDQGFKKAAAHLNVSPRLTPQAREELKKEYTNNMSIWIDKFSKEEIQALRQRVEINATQGYRFDRLIASIKNRFSVSENKATFLARQETSLFLSKFREKRFKDAGFVKYRWSDSHDARVRPDHRHLNGRIFFYDDPPIVDQATGQRGNPGQAYGCRCVDIPER